MVKLKDIAEKAGTSIAAVSIALHGGGGRRRVSKEREKLIRNIAAEMKYRPNSAARAMALKRTMQIGLLLRNAPDRPINNPANFEIVLGAGELMAKHGYVQVLVPLRKIEEDLNNSTRVFSERLLDGIIVVDLHTDDLYKLVKKTFSHALFLETNYWNEHFCIRRDEEKAAFTAAKAMYEAGYRKILYVGGKGGKKNHFSVKERYNGVVKALGKDISLKVISLNGVSELTGVFSQFKPGMGIICDGSMIARRIYAFWGQAGFIPPRDYGLICCDDSHETERTFPMLSRVSFDRYDMGKQAAQMLIESLENPGFMPDSRRIIGEWIPGTTIRKQ